MSELFAGISGQDQTTSYLQRVYDADAATHAYLIAGGGEGEGYAIALRFAAGLIAGEEASERDAVLRGVHPDLHVYKPAGADAYLVDQVRELTHDAELAPIRATSKAYIIQDAQRLSGAPANALLKTLEEPPHDVTCILVASSESAVLETLTSRCEVLTLNAHGGARVANPQVFDMLYMLARGCSNQELLASSKRFVELAHEQAASYADDDMDVEAYIEKYDDFLTQGARKQIEQQGKREVTARERMAYLELFATARTWLRDCLATHEGAAELIAYPQCEAMYEQLARFANDASLLAALDAVARAAARISYNVTPQLAIDAMFMEIREALCHR